MIRCFPSVERNVATVESREAIRLRVWERRGLTLACGTGACATAVAPGAGWWNGACAWPCRAHW
jgi:diaminopimelate epimerase